VLLAEAAEEPADSVSVAEEANSVSVAEEADSVVVADEAETVPIMLVDKDNDGAGIASVGALYAFALWAFTL
jgi:hypothetical protein